MKTLYTKLTDRLDETNAKQWYEKTISDLTREDAKTLEIDCEQLSYIAGIGLRYLLLIHEFGYQIICKGVSQEVYEIFDETGLTRIMNIQKKPRKIQIDESKSIAHGTVGTIYRLDKDKVLKLFNRGVTLDDIEREKQYAQTAFILGIPTAISYEVVQVDDCYGIILEMAGHTTFSKELTNHMDQFDNLVKQYTSLLKKIHKTPIETGMMPSIKDIYHQYIDRAEYLSRAEINSLHLLVDSVPERYTMIHGDYHANNVMMKDNEMILIDLGDISYGHPIFDLAGMYVSHVLVGSYQPDFIKAGMGIDYQTCLKLWNSVLQEYFKNETAENLSQKEQLIRQFAYMKLSLMYVLAPGIENALTWKALEDARKELFYNIDYIIEELKKDNLV